MAFQSHLSSGAHAMSAKLTLPWMGVPDLLRRTGNSNPGARDTGGSWEITETKVTKSSTAHTEKEQRFEDSGSDLHVFLVLSNLQPRLAPPWTSHMQTQMSSAHTRQDIPPSWNAPGGSGGSPGFPTKQTSSQWMDSVILTPSLLSLPMLCTWGPTACLQNLLQTHPLFSTATTKTPGRATGIFHLDSCNSLLAHCYTCSLNTCTPQSHFPKSKINTPRKA